MGNGWKSAVVCGLAIVGLFAFASDAEAFGRRNRGGHHGCHGGHAVAFAPAAPCCDAGPAPIMPAAPCCDSAPIAPAAPCCDSAPVHHVGHSGGGCCGGGHHGHHRQRGHHGGGFGGGCCGGGGHVSHHGQQGGGCCGGGQQGGYGGGYPVQAGPSYAQPTSGCTNCQAPW